MNIPYGELMKYRGSMELPHLYDIPVYVDIKSLIRSFVGAEDKIIDFGCGKGWIYNDVLLPSGFKGEYVGIDKDPIALALANFEIYEDVDALAEKRNAGEFDTILFMNSFEHFASAEEMYETVIKLNKFVDGTILIQTPNPACFDYMFVDPTHKTFYSYEFLYGLLKHLDYDKIQLFRGEGTYPSRNARYKENSQKFAHFKEMNDFQRKVCMALGLDWYGNLVAIGRREPHE